MYSPNTVPAPIILSWKILGIRLQLVIASVSSSASIASTSSSATLSSANIASASSASSSAKPSGLPSCNTGQALARQLTLLALLSSARQLKSLDFPHAIPVNNIASTGTCLAAGPTVKEDTPSGQK